MHLCMSVFFLIYVIIHSCIYFLNAPVTLYKSFKLHNLHLKGVIYT